MIENMKENIFITIDVDKKPYIKRLSNDKVINLTGESGSGKSYFSNQWKDDDNYLIIDTDIVFSDKDSDNKESVDVRKLFSGKPKDYLISNFDDFYLTILNYFKDTDKFVVIDSAQYRNIKDVNILKGDLIVMRTCINTCYERCIDRWIERNKDYNQKDLDKFKERKLGMYKWYMSLNSFLENVDKL
jgi:ABC-type dipeptide/oligopeptide/nickel transport system ATPase component